MIAPEAQMAAMFAETGQPPLSKDDIAELLQTTPEALAAFEASYKINVLDPGPASDGFDEVNAKQAAGMLDKAVIDTQLMMLNDRIIGELRAQTHLMEYDGNKITIHRPEPAFSDAPPVTRKDIMSIPESVRPQLAGSLVKCDIPEGTSGILLQMYKGWLDATDPKKKRMFYNLFRQGLDILDLDGLSYEMLGTNPVAMGNWLPALIEGVSQQTFFKVPKTKIIRVPLTLLQLSRTEYMELTPGTMDIVDRYCQQVFGLDETKTYFIKTGTFSSKYDFRNAKVSGAKEVRELGEYLLYISYQAAQYASPLVKPCIYGMSTTNEWVVREFIEDKENNHCIYKGLPLHTEYRVFVDFDEQTVIGMSPYWEPGLMKRRFGQGADKRNPNDFHDYIVYKMHEGKLMRRYEENKGKVWTAIQKMLPSIPLDGQWSIDVMQNGKDFYIIDMATAMTSALVECVPQHLLRPVEENWLPALPA